MRDNRKLNIIDEAEKIIGIKTREEIHREGLLHKEIHVWFYTPKNEFIFQHRGKNQETNPNLLDATVGGHVEIGEDFEHAASKELQEETGIQATADDLTLIKIVRNKKYDKVTNKTNNVKRAVYAYCFNGKITDLKVEEGKAIGFETWPLEKIFNITKQDKIRFIPSIFDEETLGIFKKIQNLI